MMNNFLKKSMCGIFFIIISASVLCIGCSKKDKEIVVSKDVSQQVKSEENEIKEKIEQGGKYLQEKKYEDAKKVFESAIALDTGNKSTYLEIKDRYVQKNRLDDAYYIVKLAIDNNVDVENMKSVLKEIQGKLEVPVLQDTVYTDTNYTLPQEVNIKINGEETKQAVNWNNSNVDTSKSGKFNFDGVVVGNYERAVKLILTVKPIVKERKCGYVKSVYEKDGKRYLQFDEIEFYKDRQAADEAKKDGKAIFESDGKYYAEDGYYIRNKSTELKVYEISNKATFKDYDYVNWTGNLNQCTYSDFSDRIAKHKEREIFWINTENSIIISVDEQFLP